MSYEERPMQLAEKYNLAQSGALGMPLGNCSPAQLSKPSIPTQIEQLFMRVTAIEDQTGKALSSLFERMGRLELLLGL